MGKYLLTGLITFILGLGAGGMGMLYIYPFLFPLAQVNERVVNVEDKRKVAQGLFNHPNPSDPVHWGKGSVSVYQHEGAVEVFLGEDFEVGPGPDYHVYLVEHSNIMTEQDFESANKTELSRLKSFRGGQVYPYDALIPTAGTHSIVVWCKTFGQLISSANLRAVE